MSKLIVTPLLLTLIAGVAQAPGRPVAPAQAESTASQPATRVAYSGHLGIGADVGGDYISTDADAYHFAWNQWDYSSEEFDKRDPGAGTESQVRAWDEFPHGSLLADATPDQERSDLSKDALHGFDNVMIGRFANLAGRARNAGGGSTKSGSSVTPVQSSHDSSGPSNHESPGPSNHDSSDHDSSDQGAPSSPGPSDSSPPADEPTQQDSPGSPSDPTPPGPPTNDQTPPGQTPPVSVPEPTSFALFGLGLLGLRFARRRAAG